MNKLYLQLSLIIIISASPLACYQDGGEILLPILTPTRTNIEALRLTTIGDFGLIRQAREGIPAHYHTGIDIQRPGENYWSEPVFSIAHGVVISIRNDGPFAQIIIEHTDPSGMLFWSVYEHISGIVVEYGQSVHSLEPIARFMNRDELNLYGWQFDHFHLEIMRIPPYKLKPVEPHPDRHYTTYALTCFSEEELYKRYFNPIDFFIQFMK